MNETNAALQVAFYYYYYRATIFVAILGFAYVNLRLSR